MKNDPRSYDRNFCNCVKKPEKNSGLQRGLNPWPCDTGATLYQLSYEATGVGSRSILGSYVPVKDMWVDDAYEINHMWTADMKSNEEWSSQLWSQFFQLRKEAWKTQDFNGAWTRDLAIPVRRSTNWATKPLTLGAGQFWVHMFPWKICEWMHPLTYLSVAS